VSGPTLERQLVVQKLLFALEVSSLFED
jgi:hypothetical protein